MDVLNDDKNTRNIDSEVGVIDYSEVKSEKQSHLLLEFKNDDIRYEFERVVRGQIQ